MRKGEKRDGKDASAPGNVCFATKTAVTAPLRSITPGVRTESSGFMINHAAQRPQERQNFGFVRLIMEQLGRKTKIHKNLVSTLLSRKTKIEY